MEDPAMRSSPSTDRFLDRKYRALKARASRLLELTPRRVGLRPQDLPYAPSRLHFAAANKRLRQIGIRIQKRLNASEVARDHASANQRLTAMALVEREVDRARRTFGMLFEVFSQRGSDFAPALAAHDVIAADCYAAVRAALPDIFTGPLLKPLTYMEHGFSPATQRRGVALARLLGDANPFPVIRIPWDRDNPWQPVFLHEVAHNLQADMGLWHENATAVSSRLTTMRFDPLVVTIFKRWHKEIFADLAALLLGGTQSAWGMMEFLAHPGQRVLTYRPGGAHPMGWIRVLLLSEMVRRMGFLEEAARIEKLWRQLYDPKRGHRAPEALIAAAPRAAIEIVDEIAYQPRRNLAQHALADAIPFHREDETTIRRAGVAIAAGRLPKDLPPRFYVTASQIALHAGGDPRRIADLVIGHLAALHTEREPAFRLVPAALAA
jgi:hypothetical protein